ncbi:MAG TPA: VWA domain-containing protein, partial [Pyrinomonadaceae bacterium]|nr:VWA domain-containing protein [Pyrinomonadaceae bacterium]
SNFSFISNQRAQVQNPNEKTNIPKPVGTLRAEQIRRTIALVVDDLSLSFESAYRVRRSLRKFVDEQMQEGDLVAIIRTGAGIGALQQFTADKRLLYAAIERVKWNPQGRGGIGAFAPIGGASPIESEEESSETESGATENVPTDESFRSESFANATLGALQYIVSGMKDLPGRKSVILFSDGFEVFSRPSGGTVEATTVLDSLRRLVDAANRASVVFYAVDARGLLTTNLTAEDNPPNISGGTLQRTISSRGELLFNTQEGLFLLSQETGGFAAINNNDLNKSVGKILEDQSYYLIGYQPDDETFDATQRRFNKLEIRVKRTDLKARYRSGFFNTAEEKLAEKATATTKTPAQQIVEALISPFGKNDISVRLNALYGNNKDGSFARFLVHVNTQDIKFTDEPNGDKSGVLEIFTASFNDTGQIVDQLGKVHALKIKKENFPNILRDGIVYYFTFPMKKAGAYQLRIAIRDANGEKLGSANQFIEIPDIKKERLNLSGIVLENLTRKQWEAADNISANDLTTNPMNDTSLRKFKRGTILRYAYEIYNAKSETLKKPNLTSQIRIFQDGKLILEGKKTPVEFDGQTDLLRIKAAGAISLGGEMPAGDYILQIIITDSNAKEKHKTATQFVQFELVE